MEERERGYWFIKLGSRKFIVFVVATVFAAVGILSGGQWMTIGLAYFGLNYLQKFTEKDTLNGSGINRNARDHSGDGPAGNRRVHLDAQGQHKEDG